MSRQNYTKQSLIQLFHQLHQKIGQQPTKLQWMQDLDTPSDMPIRMLFGRWNLFVLECGGTPAKPKISDIAKLRSVASRRGKIGGNNKGGKIIDKFGYVQIWMPDHPNAKLAGYIHEHRLVMSKKMNRPLERYENVHHKDGNRQNNIESNLELWDTTQPSGQRVKDKIDWAIEFLNRHGYNIYENPELLNK